MSSFNIRHNCAAAIEPAKKSLSGKAVKATIDEVNKPKALYATPVGFALFVPGSCSQEYWFRSLGSNP